MTTLQEAYEAGQRDMRERAERAVAGRRPYESPVEAIRALPLQPLAVPEPHGCPALAAPSQPSGGMGNGDEATAAKDLVRRWVDAFGHLLRLSPADAQFVLDGVRGSTPPTASPGERAAGRAEERADVVAWFCEHQAQAARAGRVAVDGSLAQRMWTTLATECAQRAEAIERGDHLGAAKRGAL